MTIRIGIFGAGRFANAIAEEIRRMNGPAGGFLGEPQYTVAWMLHHGERIPDREVDVAIDASVGAAVESHLEWALATRTPLVIGATGWDIPDIEARVGRKIGVLISPNFSFAVALMQRFAAELATFADWYGEGELSLFEHHHNGKKDAPSGTAKALANAIIRVSSRYRGWSLSGYQSDSLSIACLRAGSEVGTHRVVFDAPHEQMVLEHRARDRGLFASGALKGARWILRHRGVFQMNDMVDEFLRIARGREARRERSAVRAGCSDRDTVR